MSPDEILLALTGTEVELIVLALRNWDGWDAARKDTIDDDETAAVAELVTSLAEYV
jgi:hypothetical protein